MTTEKGHWIYPIDSFRDIFARGFKDPVDSYKTKLAQIKISSLVQNGAKPIPRYPKLIKHKIETSEQFIKEFYEPNKDKRGELLAWDLETSGLSFLKDRIGCITLSYNGTEGFYIPWKIVEENDNKLKLREILKNSRQVLANGKFDVKYLWRPTLKQKGAEGHIILEDSEGVRYKIPNHTLVEVENEKIEASGMSISKEAWKLEDTDTIKNWNQLVPYKI